MARVPERREVSRRGVLAGIGAVGAAGALAATAGCDAESDPGGTADKLPPGGYASSEADRPQPTVSPGPAGTGLGPTAQIPVGGGHIFDTQKVVVTQPTAGHFVGLSAVCTHMGCLVGTVTDGVIGCPCHGSEFAIADGHVVRGPAQQPLPKVAIEVAGGEVALS